MTVRVGEEGLLLRFFVSSRVLLERRRSRSGSSTRGGKLGRGLVVETVVRMLVVVFFLTPSSEPPRFGQVGELLRAQQLVPQAAEERFRETDQI